MNACLNVAIMRDIELEQKVTLQKLFKSKSEEKLGKHLLQKPRLPIFEHECK